MKQSKMMVRVVILVGLMASLLLVLITNPLSVNSTRGQGDPTSTPDRTESVVALEAADVTELRAAIVTANNDPTQRYRVILTGEVYALSEAIDGENAFEAISGTLEIVDSHSQSRLIREYTAPSFRFFEITSSGKLHIEGHITFYDGESLSNGGAILNAGELSINGAKFVYNSTPNVVGNGGAIFNNGIATIANTIFDANYAETQGGHIYNIGTLTLSNNCFENPGHTIINRDQFSLYNDISVEHIIAINNWWGAVDGPSGMFQGNGDSISDNISIEPFLLGPPDGCSVVNFRGNPAHLDRNLKIVVAHFDGQGLSGAIDIVHSINGYLDAQNRVWVAIYYKRDIGYLPNIVPPAIETEISAVSGRIVEVNGYQIEAWLPINAIQSLGLHPAVAYISANVADSEFGSSHSNDNAKFNS